MCSWLQKTFVIISSIHLKEIESTQTLSSLKMIKWPMILPCARVMFGMLLSDKVTCDS